MDLHTVLEEMRHLRDKVAELEATIAQLREAGNAVVENIRDDWDYGKAIANWRELQLAAESSGHPAPYGSPGSAAHLFNRDQDS